MRSYTIVVNGKEFNLNVNELAADRFQVLLGDAQYEVQLTDDSELPQAVITPAITASQPASQPMAHAMPVSLPPVAATTTGVVPTPVSKGPVPAAAASNSVTAPMPGGITKVEVEAGSTVTRGQVLLTLEAMKMYNAIRSPRDGVVAEVLVQAGQQVAYGDVLVRFQG
ncbi:MAG: biotin/lipoyl-containing protein [Thermoanaerobaculia bacterium]